MKDGKTIENPEWIKRKMKIETGEYKIIEEIEEFECKKNCIFYDEDRCMEGNIPMCRRKHCNYISGKDCNECEYFEGYDYY